MTQRDDNEPWPLSVLQGCAAVLGETQDGLTGSQIGSLLAAIRMADPAPTASKAKRLEAAFVASQNAKGTARGVMTCINHAMQPASYVRTQALFTLRQDRLNEVLTFVGLRVRDEGRIGRGAASATLDEAARHATALVAELERRRTHSEVMKYATLELLQKNNFHACLEASKSVFVRLREMANVTGDGAAVADKALALGKVGVPLLAINSLRTESEQKEQTGFTQVVAGLYGMFRNPIAHDPRAHRTVTDDELLELFTTLSMVHRRLDGAHRT